MLAQTIEPPYYAVIFSSVRTDVDENYNDTSHYLRGLAEGIDGFLGLESARNEVGITISYWRDLESINQWRHNMEHQQAKAKGRKMWYSSYKVRIAKVEREYAFEK